jgi:thiol:disulfide interchange protein
MDQPNPIDTRPSKLGAALTVGMIVVLALLLLRQFGGGAAATPPAFEGTPTLADAKVSAAGKPVLVFATADWCGPCQAFKRGALRDRRVTDAIGRLTVPVYLDIDKAKDDAASLGIFSIPALVVIREGRASSKLEGVHDAERVVAWLEEVSR